MKELEPNYGAELITEERERQVNEEGWSPEHDDDGYHANGELALFACCLASPILLFYKDDRQDEVAFCDLYPSDWDHQYDKRKRDDGDLIPNSELPLPERIRNLVKAGALIAAEIDRLHRLEVKSETIRSNH